EPSAAALDHFRDMVRRAATGAPIAYITGTKEFFSLVLEVSPEVLIPRPDTEILVQRTIALARKPAGNVRTILDVRTVSRCIAVTLAKHLPDCELFASDVSDAALEIARRNAQRHGVADRVQFANGDLLVPWDTSAGSSPRFDVIVANLPYVATRSDNQLAANVR